MNLQVLKNKKFIAASLIGLSLTGIIGFRIYDNLSSNKERASLTTKSPKITVETGKVTKNKIKSNIMISANLEPFWSADISSKVDGRINRLYVNEGDIVSAGDIIASLDSSELNSQVMQAQGTVYAAQASLEQAENNYQRIEMLARQGAVSTQSLDNAKSQRDLYSGQLQASTGSLNVMKEKLNNSEIYSPKNGVVYKRHVQEGTFTKTGAAIVSVADTSSLLAKGTIGEKQYAEIGLGKTVSVKVDAFENRVFEGVISKIAPVASTPTHNFAIEVTILNGNDILKAGMSSKIQVVGNTDREVLSVPESSIVMKEDQKTVFLVGENNVVFQKVVKTGYTDNGLVEITEGLNEGDRIVISGQNKIKEGNMVDFVNQ